MPKSITFKHHLSSDELYKRYKNTHNDKVARRRWKALYYISIGYSGADAARKVSRSRPWVTKVVADYNRFGHNWTEFKTQGKGRAGRKLTLTCQEFHIIRRALRNAAEEAKLTNTNHKLNVAELVEEITARTGKNRPASTVRRHAILVGSLNYHSVYVPGYKPENEPSRKQRWELGELIRDCERARKAKLSKQPFPKSLPK